MGRGTTIGDTGTLQVEPLGDFIHNQCVVAAAAASGIYLCSWEESLIHGALQVPEIRKMQEVVTILANLQDAANQLPEGTERQNALREVRGYQIRMAAFVRRLGSEWSLYSS
jgi:hypothetical protein